MTANKPARGRHVLKSLGWNVLIILITLAVVEIILQILNPAYLRFGDWGRLGYEYDSELGWLPVPNSDLVLSLPRTVTVRHNSHGLRDVEIEDDGRPAILFLGDSFVWGYNVEDGERFTERLRSEIQSHRIVNAGVAGYGTDQAFLLMKRLWDTVKPDMVVLMFCVENDRDDNSNNLRYFTFKPYLQATADGGWQFAGLPPPKSRRVRMKESPFGHFALVRLAISAYAELRHWRVTVPDPTEPLVAMTRDYVETRGGRFAVGVQRNEPRLEAFLRSRSIPHVTFDGADLDQGHWSPDGHAFVARRLTTLFTETALLNAGPRRSKSDTPESDTRL